MPDFVRIDGTVLHVDHRAGTGRAVVFLNSLGTDLRIWDAVVERLPVERPILRMDKRGHGLSQTTPADMARYAADVAATMERFGLSGALVCGVSVGGMIAQELALARPDLVAGLLLSNTGARIGDVESWTARIDALRAHGIDAMADAVLERWFSADFRVRRGIELEGYRAMLTRTPPDGYANCCAAIRDTDLRARTGDIAVPAICLAGTADLATPPELLADLAESLPRGAYREIEGVGHLPCIERPDAVAEAIRDLWDRIG
ncbi:3-oxoadipate enol-lactonase [Palleronia sp. LCG004]|uniref:3-oxoadipate enol-lactonase n=1 Tax=Palleronia sp. LCG004 TaxID=3079304 RepID=UPI002942F779|nr:3-oxoadipate enol-lactonase [Palleronia sp. LCG004]WOI57873.1 3-oxoadipate enol-lactonase [Palleronia sp. LCG004]